MTFLTGFPRFYKKTKYRRKTLPWFRRGSWGTVYLMQSGNDERLFKVGFTTRKTTERRSELKQKTDGDLRIVSTVSMPHAYFTEQHVLRGLRSRLFGWGDKRGTEWFWLRKGETLEDIEVRIRRSARTIRFIAKLKLSWSKDCAIKEFKAKT